ncbi:hypothetical protein LCGC14_2265050 [marine sediment metagenome]|uniref:Uncharacterized protein n=1 Tax=marine sediment metagenome TaxID=412755 RepID=A0A0F9CYV2_9ZZZZ
MDKATIKLCMPAGNTRTVTGHLFYCCGLRLVIHRRPDSIRHWRVSEYSTGQTLPIRNLYGSLVRNTIKSYLEYCTKFLNNTSSIDICNEIQRCIDVNGLLN